MTIEHDFIEAFEKYDLQYQEDHIDDVSWYELACNQKLSEEFIEKYQDKLNWFGVFKYQKLSEEFFRKYKDKINWFHISFWNLLPEEFIDKYQDYVDWIWISANQKLSWEFISQFIDKLYINHLMLNDKISKDIKDKLSKLQILNNKMNNLNNYKLLYDKVNNVNSAYPDIEYQSLVDILNELHLSENIKNLFCSKFKPPNTWCCSEIEIDLIRDYCLELAEDIICEDFPFTDIERKIVTILYFEPLTFKQLKYSSVEKFTNNFYYKNSDNSFEEAIYNLSVSGFIYDDGLLRCSDKILANK